MGDGAPVARARVWLMMASMAAVGFTSLLTLSSQRAEAAPPTSTGPALAERPVAPTVPPEEPKEPKPTPSAPAKAGKAEKKPTDPRNSTGVARPTVSPSARSAKSASGPAGKGTQSRPPSAPRARQSSGPPGTSPPSTGPRSASPSASAQKDEPGASIQAAPLPPTLVVATGGTNQIGLTWVGSLTLFVDGYTATATNGATTKTCGGTGLGCTMTNVPSGTWSVSVVTNKGGEQSVATSPVNVAVVDPYNPPGSPTNVVATPGVTSITLNWAAPNLVGAGIASYTATALLSGQSCTTTQTTCTITGLTAGTLYTFSVVATGPGTSGTSAPSGLSTAVAPGPPGAPTLVTAVAGPNQAVVGWLGPLNAGGGIAGYTVTSNPGGKTCTTTLLTCTVTGLTSGVSYTFSVVTVGTGATGTSTAAVTSAVTPGPPSPPKNVKATVGALGIITVTWDAPDNAGGGIAGFTASADPGLLLNKCVGLLPSDRSCSILGLLVGQSYTVTVVANGVGLTGDSQPSEPTAPIIPGPPGAPTGVTATAGTNSATVSWSAPSNAGAGITGYLVSASPGILGCATSGTSCTVNGLTPGAAYTFTVVATSLVGSSPASAATPAVTPGPPGIPTGVTASPGQNAATVSWTAPSNAGGGIASYTVTSLPGGKTCTTATTSCTVSGLTSGVAYTFSVVATGAPGTGSSLASLLSLPVVPGPPGVPTLVTAIPRDRSAVVAWLPPLSAGAGIDHYTVTSTPDNKACTTSLLTCTVTGLTPGTAYTFTVTASGVGTTGDSAASAASSATKPGPPGSPTNVQVTAGNGFLDVSWDAPLVGSELTGGYVATTSPGARTCVALLSSTKSCRITGVDNGTQYQVSVVSVGVLDVGDSAPSTPSGPVTPLAPTAPQNATAAAGNFSATVSWQAPTVLPLGFTLYRVTASPGGATCTTLLTTSCTVAGLVSGTSYTFSVVAVGLGSESPAAITDPAIPGPPGTPAGVTATPGQNKITVSWTAPANPGGGIARYDVTALPGGATCTAAADATSCVVNGLDRLLGYTFGVVAVGTGGTGSSLPGVTVTPVSPGPPGAPTLVVAVPGSNAATVSWTPPLATGAGVASYTVTASPGGRTCSTTGLTCTVTGLTGGAAYTFTVTAVGSGSTGASTASAPSNPVTPGPAGAPTNITATAGNGEVTVSWTAPAQIGGGISTFLVTALPSGNTCVAVSTSCTITGLTNGQPQTIAVVAVGVGGTGVSVAGNLTGSVTPGPPAVPTNVTATPGTASATVQWTAPASAGAGLTGYTVTSSPGGFSCFTLVGTSCVVGGLAPGTAYTFTVVANGVTGDSAASAPSPAVTPGPPGAPSNVTAVATTTPGEVTVSWSAPANTGSGVATYTVTSIPGGLGCTVNALTCTVSGLTDGVPYTFTVVANGVPGTGVSTASAPSGPVLSGPPDAPTAAVAAAGNGQATVTWVAPAKAGAGITGYVVTSNPDGKTCTAGPAATACVVNDLTNTQPYTFTVTALGRAGDSPASAASLAVVPTADVPGSPTGVTATANGGTVTVSWTAPAGGGATGYTATLTPGGATCSTTSATTCDITVGPGTYAVSVVAESSGGVSAPAVATVGVGSPGIPTGVQATVSGGDVIVSWAAPTFAGAGIDGYSVRLDPGGHTCTTNGALTCTVSGVPAGSYTATVEVNGPGGISVPTAVGVITGAPGVPTGVTVTPGSGQITVSWTAPAGVGAGLAGYRVVLSPNDGGCQVGTGASSCVITGLTDGTPYTVTVLALGPGGDSLPAAGGLISTGAPAAPTDIQVAAGTNGATVSWTAPTNAGAGLASYVVTSSGGQTCTALVGDTTCVITGLDPGVPYTFTVVGVGPGGLSVPSLPSLPVLVGPPGTPTGVDAVVGEGQATVSWTAPGQDGAGIDHFLVTATPGGQTCLANAAATSCVITGLSNANAYTFSVVAVGEDDTGLSLPTVTLTPVTPGPPGAPTAVVAVPGAGSATVQWVAPLVVGPGVASYTVTASPGGRTCTATGTSCVVTGLVSGTPYTFGVVAVGTAGSGTSPSAATVVPVTPGPPGAPTGVVVTPGLGSASVRWTAPSLAGAGVASYTVTASPGGAQCTTVTLTCVVSGLNPLLPHTFSVVANGVGNTGVSVSAAIPPSVIPGPPGAPTGVTAVPGDRSATVSWLAPAEVGAGLAGYTVTASSGQSCSTALFTCVVTGLTAGVPVTFTVIANGVSGDSPASAASTAVTPGPPGAPTNVTVTPGAGSASVQWTAPASPGAGISLYRVTAAPGGATCVTAGTACVVPGLVDGTPYTFTVRAVGAGLSGESAASVPSSPVTTGAPGSPTITTVVAGSGQATVSWTAPAAVGAGLTGYEVTASPGGASCATSGTSCVLTGLTDGVAYVFTVVASGPAGNSLPAVTLVPTVTGPPDVPTAVTASAGNGQASVTWTAPANGGAGILGYTVTSTPPGLGCVTTGATSCLVTGLSNGTAYTFTVVANGVAGVSGASSATLAVTPNGAVPNAPGNVTVTPGTGQATVSWTAVPGATGYTVTAGSATCASTGTSCTLTGLTDGVPYTVSVTATGTGGVSAPAVVPAVVTGAPSAPRSVNVVTGNSTATVSWLAPLSLGAGVTGYRVTLSPGGLGCQVALLTCTITGLQNGQTYTASVVAVGVVGDSVAGVSAAVPTGPPGAPTGVTVTPGSGGVTVAWTAPTALGGGLTSYTATASPGGAQCTTIALTCQLTGLTPGQLHLVTVTATGPGGTSVASVPPTQALAGPPGAPASVVASVGNGRSAVSWSLPTQAGAGIDHYVVTSSGGQTCTTTQLTCTITGLTNGVPHTFTVVAYGVGQTGNSPLSAPSAPVTPSASLAGAPTTVTATAGNASIHVAWTPSATTGDGIDHHVATAYPDGKICRAATASSCTITGLVNGRTYRVVVGAVTTGSASATALSDYVTGIVPRGTLPANPVSARAVAGDGTATVSWPASAGATGYTVTASPGGATCTSTGLTCTVSGLTNGTRYTFAVRATVAGKITVPSPWSNAVTPSLMASAAGAPAMPADVKVVPGDGALTVSWTQPTGAAVVDSQVTVEPGGLTCVTTGTSCTVSGLTNGTAYQVQVVARGPSADSPAASAPHPAVPSEEPGPVTGVTVTPRYSSLVVSWTPPVNQGSGIAYYSAQTTSGNGWCVGVGAGATECTMFVPIDSDYDVVVRAHGLHDRQSDAAYGSSVGRPGWLDIPDEGPSGAPNLTTSEGSTNVSVNAGGETVTVMGSDFAPNSSVQIVLYEVLSGSGSGASVETAMAVLATVTVEEDGTFTVPADIPDIDPGTGSVLAAYGVAPDGSVRSLHVPVSRATTSTPGGPVTQPVVDLPTKPITGGSGGNSGGSSSGGSDSLAKTGAPITGLVLLGLLLLLLGLASSLLARFGRPRGIAPVDEPPADRVPALAGALAGPAGSVEHGFDRLVARAGLEDLGRDLPTLALDPARGRAGSDAAQPRARLDRGRAVDRCRTRRSAGRPGRDPRLVKRFRRG